MACFFRMFRVAFPATLVAMATSDEPVGVMTATIMPPIPIPATVVTVPLIVPVAMFWYMNQLAGVFKLLPALVVT